jgi:hypothetical protein
MKRIPLINSLKVLCATGLLGFLLECLLLPAPSIKETSMLLAAYGVTYLFTLLGPLAWLVLLPPSELKSIYNFVPIVISVFLIAWWAYCARKEDVSLTKLSAPIVVWVIFGTVSTILGLAAGV